jgi:hypothetical protein
VAIASTVLATLVTMAVPASLSQTPEGEAGAMDDPCPVHIHAGTCAELGDVIRCAD